MDRGRAPLVSGSQQWPVDVVQRAVQQSILRYTRTTGVYGTSNITVGSSSTVRVNISLIHAGEISIN